jgi:AraC family transcriptional regulator, regulatory protein of adaptative response / methylated-DNA-[protein]-cysteine methyltransferase
MFGTAVTAPRALSSENAPVDAVIGRVREYLRQHADEAVSLANLARMVDLSPGHLQRRFRAAMGCSPKDWQRACRERLLRERLRGGEDVASAVYGAGYGSGSRVYESAGARLGMTPGQYARGGKDVAISVVVTSSPFGRVLIAATDLGICSVRIGHNDGALRRELSDEFPHAHISEMPKRAAAPLRSWIAYVTDALRGGAVEQAIPLVPKGSDFQIRVWELLRRIPSGTTRTYAELAHDLGRPSAVRAVARACATNPIAVLIPCHRVIRGDGELAGYRWGLPMKRALLAREQRVAQKRADKP